MGYAHIFNATRFKRALLESGAPICEVGTVKTASTTYINLFKATFDTSDTNSLSIAGYLGTENGGADTATLHLSIGGTTIATLTSTDISKRVASLSIDISSYTGENEIKLEMKTNNAANYAHTEDLKMWAVM